MRIVVVAVSLVLVFFVYFSFLDRRRRGEDRQEIERVRESMRVVCVSDTHGAHEQLDVPDGDVFIHAGDFSDGAQAQDIARFDQWLGTLPHPHKIVIGGNMDFALESLGNAQSRALFTNATYLCDSLIRIDGVTFYGSPYTPKFFGVFQLYSDQDAKEMVEKIPNEVDVLITHGPPHGILDSPSTGNNVGCPYLRQRVEHVQPKLHVFGHIHASFGRTNLHNIATTFGNCAQIDLLRASHGKPLVFELPRAERQ